MYLFREPQKLQAATHFEGRVNYTLLHFEDGSTELFAYTLKHFEAMLAPTGQYLRIHKSHLVRRRAILSFSENPRCVELVDGRRLPVSRRKKVG